jgi:hypothetical protein
MARLSLALAAALIAGVAHADTDEETEPAELALRAAIKARDAKAIAGLLSPKLDVAGVWFADAGCAKRFAAPGPLAAADAPAFARCLAQLRLQVTTRHTATPRGAVLTYDPGIELEAVFDGRELRWIGYEGQGRRDENLPTLSTQAFEALRKSGSPNVDAVVGRQLATAVARQGAVSAWVKLCLDATGAISLAELREATTPDAGAVLLAVTRSWTFRPFQHAGKKQPACSMVFLVYPASRAPSYETLPYAAPAAAE